MHLWWPMRSCDSSDASIYFMSAPTDVRILTTVCLFPLQQTKALAEQNYTMCETANLYVQSKISEDRVIESAKSVAGATAQLFIVAQIKVETGSEHHKQLQVSSILALLQLKG